VNKVQIVQVVQALGSVQTSVAGQFKGLNGEKVDKMGPRRSQCEERRRQLAIYSYALGEYNIGRLLKELLAGPLEGFRGKAWKDQQPLA
jgi:hypothetical protein